jgi:hypothetical protein
VFQNLLKRISTALISADIPYMVIGGQAVLLYGEPRLTKDIDITLGVNVDRLKDILSITKDLKLKILIDNVESFVQETMVLPVEDKKSKIRIDFIFSYSPYEKQALNRVKAVDFEGHKVMFVSLEDLVIHKIISGRARDMEDIHSILIKNKNIDFNYIEKWLQEFDQTLNENFGKKLKKLVESL